jgi:CRISPR-associated protein Csb1
MIALDKYDGWLADDGPAALVLREHLVPVEGADGVLFPATFAAAEDKSQFAGGYNIDTFPDGTNVCLVDSVGSQANRIEPIFARPEYAGLVPQVVISAGEKTVNLLEAGHRAGDAIVRCSELQQQLRAAFKEVLKGNAEPLARIAPTSLVFGVWDSRDTQAKLPRLIASTIRAFKVRKLTRSAQYVPAADYVEDKLVTDPDEMSDGKERTRLTDAYAERGFVHVPASASHGGVIADGGIRRDATLGLAALRLLAVRVAGAVCAERTRALRRYILGLSLTALTAPQSTYLRQGCNLVLDIDKPRDFKLVHGDGRRLDLTVTHSDALAYAEVVAAGFGVGQSLTVAFDRKLADLDVKGEGEKLKGEITAVDPAARTFTLKLGKSSTPVATTEATAYVKGRAESTFDVVVVVKAKVEVEMAGATAVKVTAK